MSISIESATVSGPLSSPDNSCDPALWDHLLSAILSTPSDIGYLIDPTTLVHDVFKSPSRTFTPGLAPVYQSTHGYRSQYMTYVPMHSIPDTDALNPSPEDPFSSSYDAFMSSPRAPDGMLPGSSSFFMEQDPTPAFWLTEPQTTAYPFNSLSESLALVPAISVFEPIHSDSLADLRGESAEDSLDTSSGFESSLSSHGSLSDYSLSPSPTQHHVYPISRPRSTSTSSEASASSTSSSSAMRTRRPLRRQGKLLQLPSSSPHHSRVRAKQVPAGTPYPKLTPESFKCPISACKHYQRNHRMPDFKRHVDTHFAHVRRAERRVDWVCCGVPIREAERYGITDLSTARHWPEVGRVMVGGCREVFGRHDAYIRHLGTHKGRCFGDANGSWVPGIVRKMNANVVDS